MQSQRDTRFSVRNPSFYVVCIHYKIASDSEYTRYKLRKRKGRKWLIVGGRALQQNIYDVKGASCDTFLPPL
jgi:hypothetical protein